MLPAGDSRTRKWIQLWSMKSNVMKRQQEEGKPEIPFSTGEPELSIT